MTDLGFLCLFAVVVVAGFAPSDVFLDLFVHPRPVKNFASAT